MEDYYSCKICLNSFGEGVKCPRMLQCGHSFCHSCLKKRMSVSTTLNCPTCHAPISASVPNDLPTNYLFKGIATSPNECFKKLKLEQTPTSSPNTQLPVEHCFKLIGKCKDHGEVKKFRCMESQCETWICGSCATLFHKKCRTLSMEEALDKLKPQLNNKINKHVKANATQINHVDKFLKICDRKMTTINKEMENFELRKKDTQEWMSKLMFLKSNQTAFSAKLKALGVGKNVPLDVNEPDLFHAFKLEQFMKRAKENLDKDTSLLQDFRNLLTFQDLMVLCEENSVLCAETTQNDILYAKMTAKENRIYVHSFSVMKNMGMMPIIINYEDIINRFNDCKEFPARAFIKVMEVRRRRVNGIKKIRRTELPGEIIVMVDDPTNPRGRNFMTLCSGIRGYSYIGIGIDKIDRFGLSIGTSFLEESEINNCDTYKAVLKIGSVIGCSSKADKGKLTGFQIACKNIQKITNIKFGAIEEGMEVCQKVFGKRDLQKISHLVNDCGLVFTSH